MKMGNPKILLVEDDAITAMDIKNSLELSGNDIPTVVSNGNDVLKKVLEIMPDLVLMDIILKGKIDGIEAASQIRDLRIPVVYMTAHNDESIFQRAKLTKPYGYLLKPCDAFGLKSTIEIALNQHEKGQELKGIINDSPRPLFFINKKHTVVYWNRAMETYSGITADKVIGTDQHWKAFYKKKQPCIVDLLIDNDVEKFPKFYSVDSYNESEIIARVHDEKNIQGSNDKYLNYTATVIKDIKGNIIGAVQILEV